MITINSKSYSTYKELCAEYKIKFKHFLQYKKDNPNLSELQLLGNFIPNLHYNLSNNNYFTKAEGGRGASEQQVGLNSSSASRASEQQCKQIQ